MFKRKPKTYKMASKPDLMPAIEQLRQAHSVVKTNEPINRKRGDVAQANLENANGQSYKAAMKVLRGACSKRLLPSE